MSAVTLTEFPRDAGEPLGPSFVNDLVRKLNADIGPAWAGWHHGAIKDLDAAMLAMFEEDADGRQVLTGVLLIGTVDRGIDAEQLRRVPVTALENSRNLSRDLTEYDDAMKAELAKLPPLARGDLEGEEFSRLVAAHYRIWASAVPHPAAAMAAESDVRLPTVHSWIREARLRGFLPPANRRKKG